MDKAHPRNPAKQRQTKVLIVDDHAIVRRGLRDVIDHEPDLEISAEASSPDEAISAIEQSEPDVAVVDLMFEGVSGFDLLKNLKLRFPTVKVLVLSMHDESYYVERCMRMGAMGFIMKQEASDQIIAAIRHIAGGQIYLSDRMSNELLHVFLDGKSEAKGSSIENLTDRELQVFELLGQGMMTRAVAETLHLSVKTVETHRLNIMSKLNITSPNELIRKAVQWVDHG